MAAISSLLKKPPREYFEPVLSRGEARGASRPVGPVSDKQRSHRPKAAKRNRKGGFQQTVRKYLLAFFFLVHLERSAMAKMDLDLVVNSLYQSGRGGKQVYDGSGDQSLTLIEPVLYLNSQIDHNTSVFGSLVFDALSSASAKAFDSGTGASKGAGGGGGGEDGEGGGGGDSLMPGWQTRVGAEAGYSKKTGTWLFTPTAGFSHELSYNSLHGGMNVQKFLAEDNFVLSAGLFHFSDEANPWDIQKRKFAGFKAKTTNSINFTNYRW